VSAGAAYSPGAGQSKQSGERIATNFQEITDVTKRGFQFGLEGEDRRVGPTRQRPALIRCGAVCGWQGGPTRQRRGATVSPGGIGQVGRALGHIGPKRHASFFFFIIIFYFCFPFISNSNQLQIQIQMFCGKFYP
jgi:hypothetical protein